MIMRPVALSVLLGLTVVVDAGASSSAWEMAEGGRVRLVTSGGPDANGVMRGALQIDLRRGWKTYWRDPGDAGVPPTIDVSKSTGVTSATLDFPPPHRFDDGYAVWAGYKEPVALPVTFTLTGSTSTIEADVFLGVCETICIPLQATFSVDPAANADDADDRALVEAAFDSLPEADSPDFGAAVVAADAKNSLMVELRLPEGHSDEELFVAASYGYYFGTPAKNEVGGKNLISIPILDKPARIPTGPGLDYTLVTSKGAVAGKLPYP